MTSIVNVDNYKKKCSIEGSIDDVSEREGLFRLHGFSFNSGDCLFDNLQVLLHFCYTSIELRNGLIDHVLECLGKNNIEALESYQYELSLDFLNQLHGISNIETYLCKMRLLASMALNEMQRGQWGDTFCICWVAKWLNISISIWSLTRKNKYLLFNPTANINPYCILFHDANPSSGPYGPLLYKKLTIIAIG